MRWSPRDAVRRFAGDGVYANGAALIANSLSASALGFAFWLVVAHRFDKADLGWGAAVVSAATLAALVGKAGFDAAIIRYGATARERVLRKLLVYAALATVALTAVVGIVILLLAGGGVESLRPLRTPAAATGFLVLACATSVAWILDAFFIAEQAAVHCLHRNLAFNVVKLGAPLLIVATFAPFAVPLAWGAGLGVSLLVALSLVPRVMRRRRARDAAGSPSRKAVVVYSAKTYVLNVSEFLPGLLLPLLVIEALGAEANARFFLAWTIAMVAFLGSKAIAQSGFAALVRAPDPAVPLAKAARLSVLVLAPFAVFLLVAARPLLALFGIVADDAVLLLRLLALSVPPLVATNLLLSLLKARDAGWELTLLPAAALVAVVAASPLALAVGGIVGIGIVWLGVQTASGAYSLVRLLALLRKSSHVAPKPALHRRAHEG